MKVVEKILSAGEYYTDVVKKDTIYLHHTAGSHRADWTIDGWQHDKNKAGGQLAVATAYVIGGASTNNINDTSFDGVIYKAFDDKFWAHHLGTHLPNNVLLNQKSVAIEICNYGPLVKSPTGTFLTYVNSVVPANMVTTLDKPFKGYIYYHSYTDKQIAALKELLIDISTRHGINLKAGLQSVFASPNAFDINASACNGAPGVWTHVNVLAEKFDCYPDPRLIDMLKNL